MYGTEFDGDIGYNGNHIFAGLSYGILFPFSAMAHPAYDILQRRRRLQLRHRRRGGNANQPATPGPRTRFRSRLVLTF